mmetsp:Transcript_8187/g.15405  ORF Transcript_8187/g.15405 Transcript_8187/m.15405 type:complete len:460 (-) Transcript_8187:330-1709(-)
MFYVQNMVDRNVLISSSSPPRRNSLLSLTAIVLLLCLANMLYLSKWTSAGSREQLLTSRQLYDNNNATGEYNYNDSQQQPLSCQRYCPRRINKIFFTDVAKGLSDRKVILNDLSQLAGFLCAELIIPPPKELLSVDHNFGMPVSEELEWYDFINLTFIQDGSMAVKSSQIVQDGITISSWSDVPAFELSSPKYKDWLHVISKDGKLKNDFEVIQKFSFEQADNAKIGFVWEIHSNWYQSDIWLEKLPILDTENMESTTVHNYRSEMRPYLETYFGNHPKIKQEKRVGCVYTNINTFPSHLATMQKRLVKRIERHSLNNTIFGLLHLRRGDAINDCDTSVKRMRQYFACSLNMTETLGRNITMLLTTDENNVNYRKSVMDLINEYAHVSILDADMIVRIVVKEAANNGIISKAMENNYYIFEVESILRDWRFQLFKFHLVRRRSTCKDCIPLFRNLQVVV